MSDPNPALSQQLKIDAICVRFEEQLRAGESPPIESFLDGHEQPIRSALLRHLLNLEFELAEQQHRQIELFDLLQRFPDDHEVVQSAFSDHAARRESRMQETKPHAGAHVQQQEVARNDPDGSGSVLSDSSHHGRFLPGTKVSDRYRIVSLLGKGGMGEVYRADDLKLGQTVALKFLPAQLAKDEKRLEYFHEEVRLTRQISHPNVCRVYDIGEVDGQYFLSMEYIDGEDLKILLRRIGRLPKDKGIQIAQQLCAGLSAAHDKGVLHRDLKPANIMIDGRGQVRITDFGLAKLAGDSQDAEIAGTPAYMAPEQLRNGESTVRSDLYSLGLILYEIFTGEAVNKSQSIQELLHQQADSALSKPSGLVEDMDPAVERVIMRCLEREAHERPKSALVVQAALPGGDILAAALAAGETPSPEMLVAAGDTRLIDPRLAICLLLLVLGSIPGGSALRRVFHPDYQPLSLPLEAAVLKQRCRDYLKELGYETPFKDSIYGFALLTLKESETEVNAGSLDDPLTAIRFWYRASQEVIRPIHETIMFVPADDWNPPKNTGEQLGMRLDANGRLMDFWAFQQTQSVANDALKRVDDGQWQKLLAAIVEDVQFVESSPTETSVPVPVDQWKAWTGSTTDGSPIQVDAGAYQGRIVWARVNLLPDDQEWVDRYEPVLSEDQERLAMVFLTLFYIVLALVGSVAWHNIKKGRINQSGAIRVAILAVVLLELWWLIAISRIPDVLEGMHSELFLTLGSSMVHASFVTIVYLALEPFVRRWWPDAIVGWTRLLSKGLNDPIVGRDILVGLATAGTVYAVLTCALPNETALESILELRIGLGVVALHIYLGCIQSFLWVFVVVAIKASIGLRWPGFVLLWLLATSLFWWTFSFDAPDAAFAIAVVICSTLILVFSHWGAFPVAVALAVLGSPFTFEQPSIAWGASLAALALFAFHRALNGRPIFEPRTKMATLDG